MLFLARLYQTEESPYRLMLISLELESEVITVVLQYLYTRRELRCQDLHDLKGCSLYIEPTVERLGLYEALICLSLL